MKLMRHAHSKSGKVCVKWVFFKKEDSRRLPLLAPLTSFDYHGFTSALMEPGTRKTNP